MNLGELFVTLGVKKGSAIRDLSDFSIRFLAIGKMAQEVGGKIKGAFKSVADYSTELNTTNTVTGISINQLQKMKLQAEQLGVSYESLLGSVKNLQKTNAQVMLGEGNYAPFQTFFESLSEIRDPLELFDSFMKKALTLEPAFRREFLSQAGISEELIILYTESINKLSERNILTQEEVRNMKELNKEWNTLTQNVGLWWDKIVARMSPTMRLFTRALNKMFGTELTEDETIPDKIVDVKKVEDKRKFSDILSDFKENIFTFNVSRPNDEMDLNIASSSENDMDYFNRTDPMYSYGGGVTINDNSQTTINTSDGAEQYTRIQDEKNQTLIRDISNAEMIYSRG